MRLFTAITFDQQRKDEINHLIHELRLQSRKGNFTDKENIHLTLVFIGETNQYEDIEQAMERAVINANVDPFTLTVKGIGRFQRPEGDIYWLGVGKENNLWSIQKQLKKELEQVGIKVEQREYKPHITLGRKVKRKGELHLQQFESNLKPMTMEVQKISLMKSERVQGKLIYTEIYHTRIKKD